jgi:nucleoside-diphosphate-sugar epimerase
LQVDIEKTRRLLGWTPPLALDEGLRRAAVAAWIAALRSQ